MNARLAIDGDRAVVEEMTEQTRKRECPLARGGGVHGERERTHAKLVVALVRARRVQRSLESHHNAVSSRPQLVRSHPAAISTQELVIRGAGERASVLERESHALTDALFDERALSREGDATLGGRAVDGGALSGKLFDSPRRPVRLQHWCALGEARRASVPDEVEPELFEVWRQPGAVEVARHDPRARGEARLHMWFNGQAFLDRVLRKEPRCDHHRRVRGVRAARDRSDDDGALVHVNGARAVRHLRDCGRRGRDHRVRRVVHRFRSLGRARLRDAGRRFRAEEGLPHLAEGDAVLRPLRTREG